MCLRPPSALLNCPRVVPLSLPSDCLPLPPTLLLVRQSALTRLLRGSLQAQTKMVVVVHANPNPSQAAETRQTLEFGASVRAIELGKAAARVLPGPVGGRQ